MRIIFKTTFLLFCIVFLFYLGLPSSDFPFPPSDAYVSDEPADVETPLRRGYYTNYSRAEVLAHYQNQFRKSSFLGLTLPTYRLNYPPEEAQTIIRDQARSTFLEEIVHPFRESLFVNGFEPKEARDAVFTNGVNWRQKIIVRYIPSSLLTRFLVGLGTLLLIILLSNGWKKLFRRIGLIKKPLID